MNGGIVKHYDLPVLCFGDADRSYTPPSGKISPIVELVYEDCLNVNGGDLINIPLKVNISLNPAAISLIIDYPDQYLKFKGIRFKHNKPSQPLYSASAGEIRIAWYDIEPLSLKTNDVLLYLQFKVRDLGSLPVNGFWN